jgi:DNA-binding beta-propeller fold protein YncE
VRNEERRHAKSATESTTGRFTMLSSLLRGQGSGTPSVGFSSSLAPRPAAVSAAIRRVAGTTGPLLLVAMTLAVAPAFAASTHIFSPPSIGSSGSGDGQVSSPQGVVANSTSHDVYVADTANARVDQFSSSGTFIRAWGWGVADGTTNAFQTCTSGCHAGLPGGAAGQFTTPSFIAVDNSATSASQGDVYVGDTGTNTVSKFSASGAYISTNDGSTATTPITGPFGPLAGIAVDTSGNLWVYDQSSNMFEFSQDATFTTDWSSGVAVTPVGIAVDSSDNLYVVRGFPVVEKFSSAGADLGVVYGSIDGGPFPTGLAVDPSTNDLYVDLGDSIQHVGPSCAPGEFRGCVPVESFGSPQLAGGAGLAVDSATDTVYAADAAADKIAAFVAAIEATTKAATSVKATTATLNGTVNPKGTELKECLFEYGTGQSYGKIAPCEEPDAAEIPVDSNTHTVHADLHGLNPETTYHFRISATNSITIHAEDETLTTLATPRIEAAATTNVTASAADLSAEINPKGSETTYHFEWGTTTSYGTNVPVPDADIGSSNSPLLVTTHLEHLTENTTYHWRLIAENENGTTTGVDHTFIFLTEPPGGPPGSCPANEALRTGPSANLPDCRAYEQITPLAKNGALIGAAFFGIHPDLSQDGSRVIIDSIQCFASAGSCTGSREVEGEPVAFNRTPGGWVTDQLAPPATQFDSNSPWKVNADAGTALFSMPTPPFGEDDFYARRSDGSFLDIGPATPPGTVGFTQYASHFFAATADLSHLLYSTEPHVWPSFDSSSGISAFEYTGTGNAQPLLVGVSGGPGSTDLISRCGTALGGGSPNGSLLSEDGSTVYFTAEKCSTGTGANEGKHVLADALYARIDGEAPDAHTVAISQRSPSECTTEACLKSPPADALFQGASLDGSLAFFTSTQQLTDDASQDSTSGDTAHGGGCAFTTGPNGCNLYLYDFTNPSGHELIDASAGDTSGGGPRVQGMMAMSSDGSHAYFVAKGVLAEEPNAQGQSAEAGADNLYLYQRDAAHPTGHTTFIAALPASDSGNWQDLAQANVTSDGRFLVFESHGQLTPDDSAAAQQVFRYDAQTEQLVRISIGERGFNDNGNSGTGDAEIVRAEKFLFRAGPTRPDPTMSNDGAYVFFTSPVGLTPQALNDVQIATHNGNPVYAQNLYEYHEGHVSLISDGRDTSEFSQASSVRLLGSDATGANVFFSTADQLITSDTDTQVDYYDAHIGGGFAEPPRPVPCPTSEACHLGGTEESPASSPATPGFNGPEEGPNHPRCAKGFVKRHGSCVKKHKKAHKHKKHKSSRRRAGHNRGDQR